MIIPIHSCRPAPTRSVGFLLSFSVATALCVGQQASSPLSGAPAALGGDAGELTENATSPSVDRIVRSLDTAGDALVPIHTAEPDQGMAYGIWAAGPGYKVSFHQGATFVPLLGRDYPHNQPWTWRTSSVTVGGQQLFSQLPRLSYDGLHAEYDLGSAVESYDVRADGVEQTFVLPRRTVDGDLVIRGVVASMLQADSTAPAHQALVFRDAEGRELVTYGAAVAIDAVGRTQPMTTSHEHGEITLRLDGDWLRTASYPVVVDPLLGPGTPASGVTRDELDILRDSEGGATDSVWIGYSVWASAADRDVYLRRFDDDGISGALVYSDITATWSSQGARLAYVAGADHAVMVFDRLFGGGARLLRCHRHQRTDLTSNTSVILVATSDNAWRADVGGTEIGLSGNNALLVWQQEPNNGPFVESVGSDIYACFVDLATGTAGTPFVVADTPLTDHERPSVNQTARGNIGNTWRVAYQAYTTFVFGGTDDLDVFVREIDLNGNVSAPMTIDAASPDHTFAPIIEGRRGRYLVAFGATPMTSAFPTGVASEQIRCVRVDWPDGAAIGSEPWGTVVLQSNNDARLELGGLGFDRDTDSHWALMFRSNVTELIYLRTVGYRGRLLQAETVIDPVGADTSLMGGISYNHNAHQYVIGYGINGAASNYVTMDRFAYPSTFASTSTGVSCSPATIDWSGSQQIGSEFGNVIVQGAAIDSIHAMVLATATSSVQLIGVPPIQNGCWLLVPNAGPDYLGILDLRIGAEPAWNLPLPEFLGADFFYFQDFHTVGGGLFEFVSTQRLTLPIAK